ncbi:hypothetical protein FH972_019892 [Carpinus fangiana]|uniref:Uncharacterized protein n=1 Tax=Carpinus fangiana TaxID=176857 RepID=A0A5N6RRT5_9ROSI|nr:hypothetical protein FH972_019892 [Carpinus fangiana]
MESAGVGKTLKGSLSFSSNLRREEGEQEDGGGTTVDEISIFDAHKYFNESIPTRFSWMEGYHYGNNTVTNYRETPTASSEASWNSRSGLLTNPPGAIPLSVHTHHRDEKKKKGSSRRWAVFRRKCPCSGRKSVQVAEPKKTPPPPPPPPQLPLERQNPISVEKISRVVSEKASNKSLFPTPTDHQGTTTASAFSFPILNPSSSDPPGNSLQVFRPPSITNSARMMDNGDDEEVASNTSSDLFEIESFSAYPTKSGVSAMTPASASTSTATSNHMYEPSEGSIDWSVTTAEGVADEDPMQMRWPEKSRWRSGNGLLLSCRCEKAVSVGPNPKKCSSAAEEHMPPSMKSMLRHVGSRPPMTHTQ